MNAIANQRWELAKAECGNYNRPNAKTVAIVTSHIGDDNDYSCYLSQVIFTLMECGKKDMALKIANTDPMLNQPHTIETLQQWHEREIQFNIADAKMKKAQENSYRD